MALSLSIGGSANHWLLSASETTGFGWRSSMLHSTKTRGPLCIQFGQSGRQQENRYVRFSKPGVSGLWGTSISTEGWESFKRWTEGKSIRSIYPHCTACLLSLQGKKRRHAFIQPGRHPQELKSVQKHLSRESWFLMAQLHSSRQCSKSSHSWSCNTSVPPKVGRALSWSYWGTRQLQSSFWEFSLKD